MTQELPYNNEFENSLGSDLSIDRSNVPIMKKNFGRWVIQFQKQLIPIAIFILFVLFVTITAAISPDPNTVYRDPITNRILQNTKPTFQFPLGVDQYGKSWFVLLMYGTVNSLKIGLFAAVFCVTIALFFGVLGPFLGGFIDNLFQFITNIFLVFPVLPFLIFLSTIIHSQNASEWNLIIIIALFSWSWAARSIRAQVLSLRERDFVKLSKITGVGSLRIAFTDILPSMGSYIFLVVTIMMSIAILTEAGLSILGLGPTNIWTLGRMLNESLFLRHINSRYYWFWVPTASIVTFLTVILYVINAQMNEIFNPRLREK